MTPILTLTPYKRRKFFEGKTKEETRKVLRFVYHLQGAFTQHTNGEENQLIKTLK